jgi:hypothetical protein
MLERWKIGFSRDIGHFNFIFHPAGCGIIHPTLHNQPDIALSAPSRGPEPIIALFRYSIIPVVSEAN